MRYAPIRLLHVSSVPSIFSMPPAYGFTAHSSIAPMIRRASSLGMRFKRFLAHASTINAQLMPELFKGRIVAAGKVCSRPRERSFVSRSRFECPRRLYFFLPRQKIFIGRLRYRDKLFFLIQPFWYRNDGHMPSILFAFLKKIKHFFVARSTSSIFAQFQGVNSAVR